MEHLHLISKERTRRLVRRVAENDPTLTTLYRLPRTLYDADVLLALGHALIGNTHLRQLNLRNLLLTEAAAHSLAHGMAQSQISSLELSGDCQEEEIPSQQQTSSSSSSSRRSHHIRDIFYRGIQSCNTIQHLTLKQTSLTDEDPGEAWRDALLGLTKIEILFSEGHHDGYSQAVSDVLSRTTLLRELFLVFIHGEMEPNDITTLAHGLHQNTSITRLSLIYNGSNIGQRVQLLLAQGLSPNSSISYLYASNCRIGDGCIGLLVDFWLSNCPIEHLVLERNYIGPTGAQRLMQALANLPTMLMLFLKFNSGIGYEGLRIIGDELPNLQHLTHLNLVGCSRWIDHTEAESEEAQLQTRACQQAGQALLDGIKRNTSITRLEVIGNRLFQHVEDEINFYAALNMMGRRLLSAEDCHNLPPFVWCHILAKYPRQFDFGASVVYFYLKELPTLVQSPIVAYEQDKH